MSKPQTAQQLRRAYLDFFVAHGHKEIPSASLVPEHDPTVLFTTAGMHPLVPYLLGEPHPAGTRLTDVQKCFRTGDLTEVGDKTHLTFFEMLGNWSLGDYFKEEAITLSFKFLTQVLEIPLTHLAVTVFAGDDIIARDEDSRAIWLSLGMPSARIQFLGREDNWWGPAGQTGPCGPDTEMFYWTGTDLPPADYDPKDKRWVEIWNDVFMEFNKQADGTYVKLPKPNVDTGMGLERTLMILQGKETVYETELFQPILKKIEERTGRTYGAEEEDTRAMRVLADHLRAAVMLLADGVVPGNHDQAYILRALIRRAVIRMKRLTLVRESVVSVAETALETLADAYPKLREHAPEYLAILASEEQKFYTGVDQRKKTIEVGLRKEKLTGNDAFKLASTYGLPLEMIEDLMREAGLEVDRAVYEEEYKKHQALSRMGSEKKFAGGLADHSVESTRLHTATHLLHQSLRTVLGTHVEQKGSNITAERLRFDFSHPQKLTEEQCRRAEDLVNAEIQKNHPVSFELLSVADAKKAGAIGLFEERYEQVGDLVKMYTVGDATSGIFSREICGGPHVEFTRELEAFAILKEEASSAGIRRIKAVIGSSAQEILSKRSQS